MAETTLGSATYHLYTYFRSSCARRIRIAFLLKDIPVTYHYVDMEKDEHESESYRMINPSGAIPTLVVETTQGNSSEPSRFTLTQSIAILEYLEETFPSRSPLLPPPSKPEERARVREFMHIITSDIFPPTNSRIASRVRAISGSREELFKFVHQVMNEGFQAYESMLQRFSMNARYTVGNEVTLADICLIPQVEQARFYGVDFGGWPLLTQVIKNLEELDAIRQSGHEYQEDNPSKSS